MTGPLPGGMQKPHTPTLVVAVGVALAALFLYHLVHRRR